MSSKLKWPALILIGVGGYFAWQGWTARQLYERLDASGKTVDGTLESGAVKTGRRSSKTYNFDVSYTTEAGQLVKREFEVSKGFVERVVRDDEIIEDQVKVNYDPEDPQKAILIGASVDERNMLAIGGAMAVGGALLAAFAFRRKTTPAAEPH